MRVAIGQIDVKWEDKETNKKKVKEFAEAAVTNGSDIIFFPEMTLTGFSMNIDLIAEEELESVRWFSDLAKSLNIAIGFGWVERVFDKGANNFSIVNNEGEEIVRYTKIHPFSYADEDKYYRAGTEVKTVNIGSAVICPFICYDLRFPEIFQIGSKSSNVIVVIANWPESRKEHWRNLLVARSIENQSYIIGVNRVGNGNNLNYTGNSMVISPLGEIMEEAKNVETILFSEISIDLVEKVRSGFPVKKDRKEALYVRYYGREDTNYEI